MGMAVGGSGGVNSTPNVIPMADVMLVLLIIFMVATPALLAGFQATPPVAQNLKDHPTDDEVDQVLGIDKDGNFYLNKTPYLKEDIGPRLNEVYSNRDDYVMYLKADKDIEYELVLEAMDIATKNLVRVIGLISDQKPGTVSTVEGDSRAPPTPGGN